MADGQADDLSRWRQGLAHLTSRADEIDHVHAGDARSLTGSDGSTPSATDAFHLIISCEEMRGHHVC
jgi:hypothetical protein